MKETARGTQSDTVIESSGSPPQAPLRVLVVAPAARAQAVSEPLSVAGLDVRSATNLQGARALVAESAQQVVLVDAELPALSELMSELGDHACVRVLLAPASAGSFLSLGVSLGAEFVALQPPSAATVRRLAARKVSEGPLLEAAPGSELPSVIVGSSASMRPVWQLVMAGALNNSSVLITGATGTGKELVARALHRFSERRSGPFVAVNCAALSEHLLESELFGHEKGSFTGAMSQHSGRFELADGGTLFLDEIGDLPMRLQVKLLRVLQERTFERVGGNKSLAVDVRVVAATHRDLPQEVAHGRFRADLFYRINVLSIAVPPLRRRAADMIELWNSFLAQGAKRDGRPLPQTTPEVLRTLMRHTWPGNVRELHNTAEHVLTVLSGDEITHDDLPDSLRTADEQVADPVHDLSGMTLREIEQLVIRQSYEALGTVKATAAMLGVSPRKIHYRLKETGHGHKRSQTRKKSGTHAIHPGQIPARVLVAEDDDELRGTLIDVLRRAGYDAVGAPDGRAVLEHLGSAMLLEQRDAPPDVILADVRMPGMTGVELLASVRDRGWSTPVVLMSAFGEAEVRRQASDLGATAFLDKPIDTDKLEQLLRDAVNA